MIYFFLGHDSQAKDVQIAELKQKLFTSADAPKFDYEVLHAHKLEADTLKKALIAIPVLSKKRLIVIRQAQKLRASHKNIIFQIYKEKSNDCIVILDFDGALNDDEFSKRLNKKAKIVQFRKNIEINVFDLGRAITTRKSAEALKMVNVLLEKGDYPLQIIGGLVWSWGKSRTGMAPERFHEGLVAFRQADHNIKRSRLKADHALELLVVRLCSL